MFKCDSHEPVDVYLQLNKTFPCIIEPLNEQGFADYLWDTPEGTLKQIERKQWGEILSGMDKIEEQLRLHLENNKVETSLLIEGVIKPKASGSVTFYAAKNRPSLLVEGRSSPIGLSSIYAWLQNIQKYMNVIFTSDLQSTVIALHAMYTNDQKGEENHRTFQKHFRKIAFSPNPQVTKLMALGLGTGISEKRAVDLINKFYTVWNVCSAKPEELVIPGIGIETARRFLRSLGRPDV